MTILEPYRLVIATVIALVVFGLALHALNRIAKPLARVSSFPLEDTLSDIKRELQKLENLPGPALGLTLSEVKITLMVQEDDTRSGAATLAVPVFDKSALKATGKQATKTGSKVTVALAPPKGSQVLSADRKTTVNFADLLASTRTALQRSMTTEPRLDAKAIDVEISFVLVAGESRDASVDAKIVSIGATSDWQLTHSNTVMLKYVNPAFQSKEHEATPIPP